MKIQVKCSYCNEATYKTKWSIAHYKHHFCNKKCFNQWYSINCNTQVKTKCDYCGKVIFKFKCFMKMHKHHFCNQKCAGKYLHKYGYKKRKTIICKQCAKPKTVFKTSQSKFCSRECFSKWMTLNWKGKNNPHYGKKWTEESRINMSKNWHKATKRVEHLEKLNRDKKRFGKDNPNWVDGASFEPYSHEFNDELKAFIRKRDKYKCQNPDCGIPQQECRRKLHVHHIDYRKSNCNQINLIALCNSCNAKANGDRDYWKQYYQKIQIDRKVHEMEKI